MCTPLYSFWTAQLSEIFEVAAEPPGCLGWVSPPESEWRGRAVSRVNVEECRRAAREARSQIFIEQAKGMTLVAATFFSAVGLFLAGLATAGLVFEVTNFLLSSLFAIPVAGMVFSCLIYSFEAVNIALGTIVLIGKLSSKVLLPAALRSWGYAEFLENEAVQLEAAARPRSRAR